eukprot:Hpha_TRINITY_DN2735_c0_g1::TRINITY_DN2735_c0_g1_i1::g.110395::m.110395
MKWLRTTHDVSRICAQTVAEAEAFAEGGCMDILLTNQCVGSAKINRLLGLAAAGHRVGCCVDDLGNLEALGAAASEKGVSLDVYVEVNGGQNRCGVPPASEALLELTRAVLQHKALRFGGIQCYHGGIQHKRNPDERSDAVHTGPVTAARRSVAALAEAGLPAPEIVTGGGTGTYRWEMEGGVHNEMQPGSYLFMDLDYSQNTLSQGEWPFMQSLYVTATVVSADQASGRRIIDAGAKAIDLVSGYPQVSTALLSSRPLDSTRVRYVAGNDEHGILNGAKEGELPVGSQVQLIPSHCDPTVNLHDHFVCVRKGAVVGVWNITARGPGC